MKRHLTLLVMGQLQYELLLSATCVYLHYPPDVTQTSGWLNARLCNIEHHDL